MPVEPVSPLGPALRDWPVIGGHKKLNDRNTTAQFLICAIEIGML